MRILSKKRKLPLPSQMAENSIGARARGQKLRIVGTIAIICLAAQLVSASFFVTDFDTPNSATKIARNMAQGRGYVVDAGSRIRGPGIGRELALLRFFHLPGEPLFLFVAFRFLPSWLCRYMHAVVTTLLIIVVCSVAYEVLGAQVALWTGLVATLQPFVILHGPVWDDNFLASLLEWSLFLILIRTLRQAKVWSQSQPLKKIALAAAIALLTGLATITRMQSGVTLGLVALILLGTILNHGLRWWGSASLFLGIALALGLWGARNLSICGVFTVGSSHDGITLYESNYEHTLEAIWSGGQVEVLNDKYFEKDFKKTKTLSEVEADRYFKNRGMDNIKNHPLQTFQVGTIKFFLSLSGINPAIPFFSVRNLVALASNLILWSLSTCGLTILWRYRSEKSLDLVRRLFLLTLLITGGFLFIGPIGSRYHIGLDCFLWIAAATFLARQNFLSSYLKDRNGGLGFAFLHHKKMENLR